MEIGYRIPATAQVLHGFMLFGAPERALALIDEILDPINEVSIECVFFVESNSVQGFSSYEVHELDRTPFLQLPEPHDVCIHLCKHIVGGVCFQYLVQHLIKCCESSPFL